MTSYVVSKQYSGSSSSKLSIKAGIYEIKITRLEYAVIDGSFTSAANALVDVHPTVTVYTGGSLGGTPLTPRPIPQGSIAASATASTGSNSLSGGTVITYLTPSSASSPGVEWGPGSPVSYTFPYDLTIAPGGGFSLDMTLDDVNSLTSADFYYTAYFEEMRLSWHH